MIQGLLLAAGRSRRFGAPKLLAPLADGTPMGIAAARNLRAALPTVLAVVSPGDAELTALFQAAGIPTHVCIDSDRGMGYSLAAGIRATAGAAGWLVALADMPFVHPTTIRQVAAALAHGALLVAPTYNGVRGHPVGFAATLKGELLACRGDIGARHILSAHNGELMVVEVTDPGIHADVDHPPIPPAPWHHGPSVAG